MLHTHLMVADRLLVAQGRWLNSALARALADHPGSAAGQQAAAVGGLGDPGSAGPAKVAQVRDRCWARKGFRLNRASEITIGRLANHMK